MGTCSKGHTFTASYNSVQQGSWCPLCRLKNQSECHDIMASIFPELHFDVEHSISVGKSKIRIDGFCQELRLAWEYHGQQHYVFVKFFHRTPEKLQKQRRRDEMLRLE